MSALALSLFQLGEVVMGSDNDKHYFTEETLIKYDIKILTFDKNNIIDNSNATFIIGYAYGEENEEVSYIFENNLKYFYYGDFINTYFHGIKIGVSGTHGKTTTTSLLTHMLENDKVSAIIGDGTGKGTTDYKFFVFEACEYKMHFLHYDYDFLIINNIDYDHPDYFNNLEEVINAFQKAAMKAQVLIINNDDISSQNIIHSRKVTFGLNHSSDVKGEIIEKNNNGYLLKVVINHQDYLFEVPFTGEHMIYNFLAALTAYYINNEDISSIQDKISSFQKPRRRQEEYYKNSNIIIDDYAHHPTEIKATLLAVKQKYPTHHIFVVFQPHTYSRTIFLNQEFRNCFTLADEVYIAPTFTSAREEKDLLKDQIVNNVFDQYCLYNENTLAYFLTMENSVIIFMGAGDIHNEIRKIL